MADPMTESGAAHCTIVMLEPRQRCVLRGQTLPATAAGFDLDLQQNRFSNNADAIAARLGPDEFLLLSPDGAPIAARVADAIGNAFHTLVDIGARDVGMRVSGPSVCAVVNAGCPLDLDLRAFPIGMATRTLIGKVEVVMLRMGELQFDIECGRSFAPHLWHFLQLAADAAN